MAKRLLSCVCVALVLGATAANKQSHEDLMATSTKNKVRIGVHNKMKDSLLIYDQTHDRGDESQLHLEEILRVPPGEVAHWHAEEKRFFRLVPDGTKWHGEGIHVVTSGSGAAGRNFEIGEYDEDQLQELYPHEADKEIVTVGLF
eukprot:SAG31_NODE_28_length_32713_cov_39.100509_6_plen_145_part_00